jgi:hypothetical protein
MVDHLWKTQEGKHEEVVRIVFDVIIEIAPFLSLEAIDLLFEKIQAIPLD